MPHKTTLIIEVFSISLSKQADLTVLQSGQIAYLFTELRSAEAWLFMDGVASLTMNANEAKQ
jgi:hypothetical protein